MGGSGLDRGLRLPGKAAIIKWEVAMCLQGHPPKESPHSARGRSHLWERLHITRADSLGGGLIHSQIRKGCFGMGAPHTTTHLFISSRHASPQFCRQTTGGPGNPEELMSVSGISLPISTLSFPLQNHYFKRDKRIYFKSSIGDSIIKMNNSI